MKYSPGNVFVNFGILGVADFCASLAVSQVMRFFDSRKASRILLVFACTTSLVFTFYVQTLKDPKELTSSQKFLVPLYILLMRVSISGCFTFSYFLNIDLFEPLLRGKVFSITNTFARSLTAAAPMVIEFVNEPALLIAGMALALQASTFLIVLPSEVKEEEKNLLETQKTEEENFLNIN